MGATPGTRRVVGRALIVTLSAALVAAVLALSADVPAQDRGADTRPAAAPPEDTGAPPPEPEAQADEAPGIPIDFTIDLEDDSPIRDALEQSLVLVLRADEPPATPLGLVRRVEQDVALASQALRSLGYYAGQATATIDGQAPGTQGLIEALRARPPETPVSVVLSVSPGAQYTFGDLVIDLTGDVPDTLPDLQGTVLGLEPGAPAAAADILAAEGRLVAALRDAGHPFAAVPDRRAVVDHARQIMDVTFAVSPGPPATLGVVTFVGNERMELEALQTRVPFEPGTPYQPDRLADLRQSLTDLGVFSTVRIEPATELNPDGTLDMTVTLEERPRRFIGFGASFATSEGVDANVYWGHRNLFGGAERLRIDAAVGRLLENDFDEIDYSLGSSFPKPDFLARDQTLFVELAVLEENPDAFSRLAFEGSTGLRRVFNDQISYDLGISFELSEIENFEGTQEVGLIGFPLSLTFDSTDDALDPTEGARLNFRFVPNLLAFGDSEPFVRTELRASAYHDILDDGRFVLAARGHVGSIFGASLSDIPDNSRFFSGGGGSVRGFPFQGIGPEGPDGDPLGGRSVIEAGLELRWRFLGDFGLVPFIEAGGVFDSSVPDFSEDIDVGAGIGLRYYSPIGPLRLDLATPLTPDDDDDAIQFYISIGQAF